MNNNPLADRVPSFRQMAAEARQAASRATSPEAARDYEELAEAWDQLLKEIEENYR
jgi:Ribonuclease G/E